MGSYYYLGAQLPYLVQGQAPPMSSAVFKALARRQMSSRDAALLDYCTLDPDPAALPVEMAGEISPENPAEVRSEKVANSSAFIKRWREWERVLRLNLARGRAAKLKREAVEAPELPSDAVLAAKNALAIESPLEADLLLERARWDAIQAFVGMDTFSETAMYAYLLKLLLMERRALMDTEVGFTEYKALYTAILGSKTHF